ncbi:MAG: EAL domain-containing protein [Pseudomonadota bacterium]
MLHIEWMDTKRYPSPEHRRNLMRFLEEKYANRTFDLLVTVDDLALIHAADSMLWRRIPIVFGGINGDPDTLVGERGQATGIAERFQVGRTLSMALSLHRNTRRVIFITADDESGAGNRNTIDRTLASLPTHLRHQLAIEHWTPSTLDKIDAPLSDLPDGSLVFALGSIPKKEGGRPLGNEQLVAHVRAKTRVPVYSDTNRSVGHGAVGGYVNSGFENGRLMADMARRVLAGEDADALPVIFDTPQELLVDFNELKRFGLSVENIPEGAVIINQPPSIFDPENRAALNGMIAAALVLLLTLGGLVVRARFKIFRIQIDSSRELQAAHEALMEAKSAEAKILGGTVEQVHAAIAALASPDTAESDPSTGKNQGSILDEIAQARTKLAQTDEERRRAEDALRRSQEFSDSILDSLLDHICVLDGQGAIRAVNRAWRAFHDASHAHPGYQQGYIGGDYLALYRNVTGENSAETQSMAEGVRRIAVGALDEYTLEYPCNTADEKRWFLARLTRFHDQSGNILAVHTDISERKSNEERISRLAHHDHLTGLFNRLSLHHHLQQALLTAQDENHEVVVMLIDLDRFKSINDALGHQAGNALLTEVAQRLLDTVSEGDIVARLGGDEFVVVLTSVKSGISAGTFMAEKILHRLGQPYAYGDKPLHSTPSIGLSIFPADGNDIESLIKHSDVAMYAAKEQGRNNFQFFSSTMNERAIEWMQMEQDLRMALERKEFVLHYQPQIRTIDGSIGGLEALVRWCHPQKGMISPMKFIPVAEESGLIEKLGTWVLDEACRQFAQWKATSIRAERIAVNMSAHQLRSPDLEGIVRTIMNRHGLGANELELEVTESVAMSDPQRAISQLTALRELGVELAIDDFGTGYSSLAYLKLLPIQKLKLDRTFVKDIEIDENDATISAATIAMAHSLGLKVVAEGVETEAQRRFLIEHGCDILQGYLFSKPLPADEAAAFLRAL